MATTILTKTQVNKAGKTLRAAARGEKPTLLEYVRARDILLAYRAEHRVPLTKANMGLRSMVRTEGCEVEVAQRLKRVPTIIDKLKREPTMQLANMHDVGGCRAILDTVDDAYRVSKRVQHRRPTERVYDYIQEPKDTGYRGIHVVVLYDERRIEIQLRTWAMHEWAFTVERLSGRLGKDSRAGRVPNRCSIGSRQPLRPWPLRKQAK